METTEIKTQEKTFVLSEVVQHQVEKQFDMKKRYLYEYAVTYHHWLIIPLHAENNRWKVLLLDPSGQDMLTPYDSVSSYDTVEGAIEVGKATIHFWAAEAEAGT